MKTVSIMYAKSPICFLISQLLKAASKPCKRDKKESNNRKVNEWRKKRLMFLLILLLIFSLWREKNA